MKGALHEPRRMKRSRPGFRVGAGRVELGNFHFEGFAGSQLLKRGRSQFNVKGAMSMTDLELKKNVEAELNYEPSVNPAEIGVAAKDGIVTLTGRVQSYWEKMAAEHAA